MRQRSGPAKAAQGGAKKLNLSRERAKQIKAERRSHNHILEVKHKSKSKYWTNVLPTPVGIKKEDEKFCLRKQLEELDKGV